MKLYVFARHDLIDPTFGSRDPIVLLEGSWPSGTRAKVRWSLDDSIDARFEWIDEAAAYWADRLAEPVCAGDGNGSSFESISPVWLNALALRYYLVKLIRVVAYFTEVHPLRYGDNLKFIGVRGRDEDYADLLRELCGLAGAEFRMRWIDRPGRAADVFPANNRWRRGLARLGRLLEPRRGGSASRRRVVLCGNRHLLDPVCRELLARGCQIWWLYDRFALRTWLRWRIVGGGQLVCNSGLGRKSRLAQGDIGRVDCRGVDLAGPLSRWIAGRLQTLGPRQTRIVEQIDAHFRRLVPHVLILDEDATPFARAAVALARRYGARSFVVQHGAPCCRFGYAPPAADRVLVWGRSSQWQLTRWSVPARQIQVTGSPRHDAVVRGLSFLRRPSRRGRAGRWKGPRSILLLATVPPRNDRPDAVALHLTQRTYTEMLRMALAAVARLPDAELVVKLHPRAPDDPVIGAALAGFPSLTSRVVRDEPLESLLAEADCVLSCASSAGVEATLAGVPVIQLLPPSANGVLPHQQWGMFGTARSESQLERLLARALSDAPPATGPDPNVFGNLDAPAAAQIAEVVLAPEEQWNRSKILAAESHRRPMPESLVSYKPPAAACG